MDLGSIDADVLQVVLLGIDEGPRDGDVIFDRNGRRVVNLRRDRCLAAGVPEHHVDALLEGVDRAGVNLDYVLHVLAASGQDVRAEHCPPVDFFSDEIKRAELFVRSYEVSP
jgi:hypothetical protein